MEMANPLLESFEEPLKDCVTNSNWQTSKEIETQVCHRFVQTIGLLKWHSLCFNHLNAFGTFDLSAMQVCNPPRDLSSP